MRFILLILIHLLAAMRPFGTETTGKPPEYAVDLEWPRELDGIALERLPLNPEEQTFYGGFPGHIARFRAGERELVIRRLKRASRKLHPASDCLRGSGYQVSPAPVRRDEVARLWGCVIAEKTGRRLRVCERIEDQEGGNWYDVSSWYWAAAFGFSEGPWEAVTIAEPL